MCSNICIVIDKYSQVWFSHSTAELGGTLYIEAHSYIITKGISVLIFNNSEAINGGASYLIYNSSMTTTENSTITCLTVKLKKMVVAFMLTQILLLDLV